MPLGGAAHNVADDEGREIGELRTRLLSECNSRCDDIEECLSFAFCGDACYFKDKFIEDGTASHYNKYCTTYYKTNSQKTACYDLFSNMAYNNLVQDFPDSPDREAKGFATCNLCTNGTMSCNALVYGGKSPLIASHIHLATEGENGYDSVNGEGYPVISFCGDNTPGLINVAGPYDDMCAPFKNGRSNNVDMKAQFIDATNGGMSVADRVKDIAERPDKYYFNFHSLASWTHWSNQGKATGMCRGPMELS